MPPTRNKHALDVDIAVTEETTTLLFGLNHSRKLSRSLSRIIAYNYTWEKSNFHEQGPKEDHLLTYRLTYDF